MKRWLITCLIAIVVLGIGIASTILWVRFNPTLESFDNIDLSKVPDVSYCNLRNDYKKYSGRIVRLKYADLHWSERGYYLEDAACSNDHDPFLIDNFRTAVYLYEPNYEKISKTLDEWDWRKISSLEVVTVGRFAYASPVGQSDLIGDRTAYHFEIYSVEFVTPNSK